MGIRRAHMNHYCGVIFNTAIPKAIVTRDRIPDMFLQTLVDTQAMLSMTKSTTATSNNSYFTLITTFFERVNYIKVMRK